MLSETLKNLQAASIVFEYNFTAYVALADTIGRKTGEWDW